MKKSLIMIGLFVCSIVMYVASNPCTAEEKFPAKQITLFVGFAPGGGGDMTSRALAEVASEVLGQPVVVLNKPGGAGAVALGELKSLQPDGYTIGLLTTGALISPHLRKVAYNPISDFDAILHTNGVTFGLAARADSPFKTFKELIDYARANPNKVKYSSSGAGNSSHLVMLVLGDLLNIKWTYVPFNGAVEAVTAVLGGHVDCASESSAWKPYVLSGRLRLLATYQEKRFEAFPDVPTLIEMGYNIVAPNIQCYVVPKGVAENRIKILHDAFYKGVQSPKFKEVLIRNDNPLIYKNSHDANMAIKDVFESCGRIIEKHREAMQSR